MQQAVMGHEAHHGYAPRLVKGQAFHKKIQAAMGRERCQGV
jgi:hypothetical protein